MKPLIIGAHGKIGRILTRKLAEDGMAVRAMVRNPNQKPFFEQLGVDVVLGDLEDEFAHALEGRDAVVFTAGSGGHTGGDKTLLVDLWGALRSFHAAERAGIERYVMVSALKAADPQAGRLALRHYLVAKHIADDYLKRSGLAHTIVRPGRLTDEPGTGLVDARPTAESYGSIPREDVADVIRLCLGADSTRGKTFDLVSGETPIERAISAL